MSIKHKKIARRDFLNTAATIGASLVLPRNVIGGKSFIPPSERLNVACIGVGSQGIRVMMSFLQRDDVQVVSVCDVNKDGNNYLEWGRDELRGKVRRLIKNDKWGEGLAGCRAGREPARQIVDAYYGLQNKSGNYKGCRAYINFRELLQNEKEIDAVLIGTPDHLHGIVAKKAMENGKHVYCQKPMTHSVYEARKLAEIARETGLATEVATGVHASESTRLLCEWIWAGAIGLVREVHNWSRRPFWPQGLLRPTDEQPVPAGLDWDLWLGPAESRPFNNAYLPFIWRGWQDFGNGAVGDMGCYSFDTMFRVLKLTAPASIEASFSGEYILDQGITIPRENKDTYPRASTFHYHFPARENMAPVTIHWYDGGLKPLRPVELEDQRSLGEEGLLFIGDDGKILCDFSGGSPRLIPESKMKEFLRPPKTLPRSTGHIDEWIQACKGGKPADANFEYAGLVTEALLLGNVALRTGKKIDWDGPNMKVTNAPGADEFIKRQYRKGWEM